MIAKIAAAIFLITLLFCYGWYLEYGLYLTVKRGIGGMGLWLAWFIAPVILFVLIIAPWKKS